MLLSIITTLQRHLSFIANYDEYLWYILTDQSANIRPFETLFYINNYQIQLDTIYKAYIGIIFGKKICRFIII